MKVNKLHYLSLALIAVLVCFAIATLFRIPSNLKQSLDEITNAEKRIDSSLTVLKRQDVRLDSLIAINHRLLKELDSISINNSALTKSIGDNLSKTKWQLNNIKREMNKLPKDFPNPN